MDIQNITHVKIQRGKLHAIIAKAIEEQTGRKLYVDELSLVKTKESGTEAAYTCVCSPREHDLNIH